MFRTYSELSKLETFEERYEYLRKTAIIGETTFGFDRYLNQAFYKSPEWRRVRNRVLIRDEGMDLGCKDHPIRGTILIHHMNPISEKDILDRNPKIIDPEYLICVSEATHNAIHYGDANQLPNYSTIERFPNDTCPWRL